MSSAEIVDHADGGLIEKITRDVGPEDRGTTGGRPQPDRILYSI